MQDTAQTEPLATSRTSIAATHRRISSAIRRTPVIDVTVAGHATPVTLKLELLQHTG